MGPFTLLLFTDEQKHSSLFDRDDDEESFIPLTFPRLRLALKKKMRNGKSWKGNELKER